MSFPPGLILAFHRCGVHFFYHLFQISRSRAVPCPPQLFPPSVLLRFPDFFICSLLPPSPPKSVLEIVHVLRAFLAVYVDEFPLPSFSSCWLLTARFSFFPPPPQALKTRRPRYLVIEKGKFVFPNGFDTFLSLRYIFLPLLYVFLCVIVRSCLF